jgi:2-polyprenyl-3-methyl-5-hydroxy-6-metoxy-1,4-benzoquinol methylase
MDKRTAAFFDKAKPQASGSPSVIGSYVFAETAKLIPKGAPHQTAMDLGCHWGRYTVVLAETFGNVIGVDIAEQALATAEPRPNIRYGKIDLEENTADLMRYGRVDFLLAICVFEMLRAPERFCQELARIFPGARLLALIPNRTSINYLTLRTILWLSRHVLKRDRFIYNNGINLGRLKGYLEDAGFRVEAQGGVVGVPLYALERLPEGFQRAAIVVDPLCRSLLGSSYHWVLATAPAMGQNR